MERIRGRKNTTTKSKNTYTQYQQHPSTHFSAESTFNPLFGNEHDSTFIFGEVV